MRYVSQPLNHVLFWGIERAVEAIAQRHYPRVYVGRGMTEEDTVGWIDGSWVVENRPDLMPEDVSSGLGDLQQETRCIKAAKQGGVMVETACRLRYMLEEDLDQNDRLFHRTATFGPQGEWVVVVFWGMDPARFVPLEDLNAEDVDDDLLEMLGVYATVHDDDAGFMGPFVVDDTPQAREALAWFRADVEAGVWGEDDD